MKLTCIGVFFGKELVFNLENTALIIKGDMCLHNFIVEYRNENVIREQKGYKVLFHEEIDNRRAETLQVGSDLGKPKGRHSNDSISHNNGICLRLLLSDEFQAGDMYHPEKIEWYEDRYTHMQRID